MRGGLAAGDFRVQRFIGRGCYSMVYEVIKTTGSDGGCLYALKRFYLDNDSSVKCVLRERYILERIALAGRQSPFLPMLYYSLWCNYSSAFILREGAGCDLYDLLCHIGYLSEHQARFYLTEVICGLEHLHSLNIVHLDIKPENILFYHDGHVFVSDLDRSFDLTLKKKPTLDDFTGTPLFMAPEVAKGEVIDARSDVWSLGVLVAEMVAGPIRSDAQNSAQDFQRARAGSYSIRGLKRFSKPLQSFFSACLQKSYTQRPFLKDVKNLRFLKYTNWEKVLDRTLSPPYKTAEITHRPAKEDAGSVKSTDCRILSGAFSPSRPVISSINSYQVKKVDASLERHLENRISSVLSEQLQKAGYSLDSLNELFRNFDFVHPSLQPAKLSISATSDSDIPSDVKDLDTLVGDLKLTDSRDAPPSLFRRTRSRGLSIGD